MAMQPSSTTDGRSIPPTPPPAYSEEEQPFLQQGEKASRQNLAHPVPQGPSVPVCYQVWVSRIKLIMARELGIM